MTSAIRLVLGLSVLAAFGCSSSGTTAAAGGATVVPNGGSGNTTTSGGSGGASDAAGVPLTPTDGWVDKGSNTLGIQGAFFAYSDATTATGLTSDVMSTSSVCIKGTAAKVDLTCTPVAPATDCYGTFWGAAIGFNLNQPTDPTTMMGGTPAPFDASALTGFAFDIGPGTDGMQVLPTPGNFRFNFEDATTQYCTPVAHGIKSGPNTELWSYAEAQCYATMPGATAATIQKGVVKISWQVTTTANSTTPFDFCISNVRALTN